MKLAALRQHRTALIAAIAGVVSLIGSCAPLGTAAWHGWHHQPPRVLSFTASAPLQRMTLSVQAARRARVALLVDVQTSTTAAAATNAASLAQVRVSDTHGKLLLDESRELTPPAARQVQAHIAKRGDDEFSLHYDFAAFPAPSDGRIVIDATLVGSGLPGAVVNKAELTINDGIGDYSVGVTFGVFMLLAGWIAAMAGVLSLLDRPTPPFTQATIDGRERGAAMRGHLLGLLAYPLPFVHLLLMASLWLRERRRSAFVEEHGREALNFQLSMLVYLLIAFSLSMVLIGFLMLPLVVLFQVVMTIEATVQARAGHRFRYPLSFRFLRAQ